MNIPRFQKIVDGLYRGGKPYPTDVVKLKYDYGINKIISLDKECGNHIKNICKDLGIQHHIFHLDDSKESLINLFKHNLKNLLLDDGPVFFHCYHGKDRTGLLAAIFKCKFLGADPKEALQEAKQLGFGIGLNPNWESLYEKIILSCEPSTDENFATIVSNEREFSGSNDEYLDEASRSSFSPLVQNPKQYPFHSVYPDHLDQEPTRENYNNPIKSHNDMGETPVPGLYDTEHDIQGMGFVFATNMKKRSYILDMSYDITDLEKQQADKAIMCFDQMVKDMYKASEYLNLIKEPFEKEADIDTHAIMEVRAQLRQYRNNVVEYFNTVKDSSVKCLSIMKTFASDTQTVKLMKVFVSSIEELEDKVNNFIKLFSSLDDDEFVTKTINYAADIQKICDSIEEIIYNRIIKHIKANILATTWVDSFNNNQQYTENNDPLMVKLHNKLDTMK